MEEGMQDQEQASEEQVQAERAEVAARLYSDSPTDLEPIVAEPAVEPEAEPEVKEPDPWEGVPAAVKSRFDALTAQLSALGPLQERLKQAERRVGSLQNEIHAAKTAAVKVADAPTPDEVAAAAKKKQSWKDLKDEYPEWGEAIEGLVSERDEAIKATAAKIPDPAALKAELAEETGKTLAEIKAENARLREEMRLAARHPDFEDIKDSEPFQKWLATSRQDAAHTVNKVDLNTAKGASEVLDAYKKVLKPTKTAREIAEARTRQQQQAQTLSGRTQRPQLNEADMSIAEQRRLKAKQLWATP